VAKVLAKQPDKKIMMIDIAVPRDIEPAVGELPGVSLYDIDALQNVVNNNLMERKRAAIQAETIIEEEVVEFVHWLNSQFIVPTVAALKKLGNEIKEKELARALNRLGDLSDYERKVIGSLANSIVNQLLHIPITRLKKYALTKEGSLYAETIEKLFDLDIVKDKPQVPGNTRDYAMPTKVLGQR